MNKKRIAGFGASVAVLAVLATVFNRPVPVNDRRLDTALLHKPLSEEDKIRNKANSEYQKLYKQMYVERPDSGQVRDFDSAFSALKKLQEKMSQEMDDPLSEDVIKRAREVEDLAAEANRALRRSGLNPEDNGHLRVLGVPEDRIQDVMKLLLADGVPPSASSSPAPDKRIYPSGPAASV